MAGSATTQRDKDDEDKSNNAPQNLVVSCNNCNRARGAFLPLVASLRPEVLEQFVQLIREHHAKTARGE